VGTCSPFIIPGGQWTLPDAAYRLPSPVASLTGRHQEREALAFFLSLSFFFFVVVKLSSEM
jgi:hypothetical protein